jgi:hypothetical protein
VNGTDYEFPVTDNTAAIVTTQERDGKQVVTGIQLVNWTEGPKKGEGKKDASKKEAQKSSDEAPAEPPKPKTSE